MLCAESKHSASFLCGGQILLPTIGHIGFDLIYLYELLLQIYCYLSIEPALPMLPALTEVALAMLPARLVAKVDPAR